MTARRSFLARFGAAAAAFGLGNSSTSSTLSSGALAAQAAAVAAPEAGVRWQPARDPKDDDAFAKRGVHFAVCDSATHRFAGLIARKVDGGHADAVYKEMVANVVANAHFMPAGIVGVDRAQERGYSIAYVG